MNRLRPRYSPLFLLGLALVGAALLAACSPADAARSEGEPIGNATSSGPVPTQQLRLINQSQYPLYMLVLRFPASQVAFNDLLPGQTSVVRDIPYGIYGDAEFSAKVGAQNYYDQTGLSWAGQAPLTGSAFTFVIDVDRTTLHIKITSVHVDIP